MTTLVDQFYYIFDGRQQRTLVLDRRTGDLYARRNSDRARLMTYMVHTGGVHILRRFALWCAEEVTSHNAEATSETMQALVACGMRMANGHASAASVEDIRSDAMGEVVLASAVGLSYHQPEGAALLVAYACTHADPMEAALDAAHMSERWAEFCADPYERAEAVEAMRQRHINYFLDQLNAA